MLMEVYLLQMYKKRTLGIEAIKIRIEEANLIPDWLKDKLKGPCSYCGSEFEVGYSPNNARVTKHYCPNISCPGTVAMKMVFVWTLLKVEGIKFGRSMELIKKHGIKNHMDAIPHIFSEPPKMDLATFMRLNCIQGIDDGWNNVCDGKESLEEVLNTSTAQKIMSPQDMENVKNAAKYVEFVIQGKQKYKPVLSLTVMMTGDVMELSNRELLIPALNQKYKGLLDLRYSKSKRKTGVNFLLKEEKSAVTGKVNTADENGIPIVTSLEFILYVDKTIKERVSADEYADVSQVH